MKGNGQGILHLEVMQNGYVIAQTQCPLSRSRTISIGPYLGANLKLPYYPLSKNFTFMEISKRSVSFVKELHWHGFINKGGKLMDLAAFNNKIANEHVFKIGDFGSIHIDDLQVLFKIEKAKKQVKTRTKLDPAYRPSLFSLCFDGRTEKKMLALGGLVAVLAYAPLVFLLKTAEDTRPKHFSELSPLYISSFFNPRHLSTAPEALKMNLDRRNYYKSTYGFYNALTAMMMGWSIDNKNLLFEPSTKIYKNAHLETDARLEEILKEQKQTVNYVLSKPKAAMISIPAVRGESIQGKILRMFEKLDMVHDNFEETLKIRRQVIEAFKSDEEYDFKNYRKLKSSKAAAEKLAKISPFHMLTNEQEMYKRAEELGFISKKAQFQIKRAQKKNHYLSDASAPPLGIKEGVDFASFLNNATLLADDTKLGYIEAAEFGSEVQKKAVAKEPLIGEIEPELIERAITKNKYELQLCYELALRRNEQVDGKMEWSFRIDTRGKISDIELVSTNIRDRNMVRCVRKKIAAWDFPRPRRGAVEVTYPFQFSKSAG